MKSSWRGAPPRALVFGLWLAAIFVAAPALAQNKTCPTAAPGDSTNKCASTAFVQGAVAGGTGIVTPPGGSPGQIEYNNAGAFGGFTQSGDCTTNTATGVTTCAKLQNVPVTTSGASTNDVMYFNGSGWLHNALLTLFNTICTASPTSCAQLFGYLNVKWYGAVGDGITDDTTAFQNAWNAACGPSGFGSFFTPPTANSYAVTKINGTNCNNIIIAGGGDQSVIKINGSDAQGNWLDLSGSSNIQLKYLKIIDNGSPVAIGILWACTGTSCGTSGVLMGLSFDHVNWNVKHSVAGLYGYGYGCAANCGSNISGGSLSITNSSWQNTNNAGISAERTRNATLKLTAYNAGNVRSAYVTLTTSTAIAARGHLFNVDLIDRSTTGTTLSNNGAINIDGTNQLLISGGSLQCQCVADLIGWTSVEGLTIQQTAFQDPVPGSACATTYWIELGGGANTNINLQTPFWSCPGVGGAYIALDQATGAASGGLRYSTIFSNDPGLNTNNVPFIGKTAAGCGPYVVGNSWISNSQIMILGGANNVVLCGGTDAPTTFWNVGTVTIPGGATDASHHF